MAGSRSKKLPNLSEYVRAAPTRPSFDGVWGIGCLAMCASLVSAFVFRDSLGLWGIIGLVALAFPILPVIFHEIEKRKMEPKNELEKRSQEASELIQRFKGYLDGGRLHRHLEPVAAAVLEQSARNWIRVRDAVQGEVWAHPQLPQHWKDIRDQSLKAANGAMEDIILLLRTSVKTQPKAEDWQVAFTEFFDELLGRDRPPEDTRIPPEFEPAVEIGQKLARLANEVEEASRRLHRDEFVKTQYTSSQSIDVILGELHAINEAETELQQDVRG